MKVALVHDWLTGMRGGERVLEVICELFPEADLYTLLHIPGSVSPLIENRKIHTSFIQNMPQSAKRYRNYLPFFPRAIEKFDMTGYDLIFSCSHCVAKGIKTPPGAVHICYCFTPMRYVWDLFDQYFGDKNFVMRAIISHFAKKLRKWDVRTLDRVTHFSSISKFVQERIQRHYNRQSEIIYPPVECHRFKPSSVDEGFYLVVSAFAPYKRIDLAVEAFNKLGLPLKIIGSGQDEKKLRAMANPNIEFLGWQSDEKIAEYYAKCSAFIFPGEEDFGITPLEAQASGKPVIAYGSGGALETVVPQGVAGKKPTGVFFGEQTVDSLLAAVKRFEENRAEFIPAEIRKNAELFDRPVFKATMKAFIDEKIREAGFPKSGL